MITSIITALRRCGQALEARRNERRLDALTIKRHAENGIHLGAAWLFIALAGCGGPRETTADVIRMQRSVLAECSANAARIAEEAPTLAEGEAELEAELDRCKAELRAICEPRGTCGEVFR